MEFHKDNQSETQSVRTPVITSRIKCFLFPSLLPCLGMEKLRQVPDLHINKTIYISTPLNSAINGK